MPIKLPDIDPLSFIPIRYQDMRTPVPSGRFEEGKKVLFAGKPLSYDIKSHSNGNMMIVTMQDEEGYFFIKLFRYTNFHKAVFSQSGKKIFLWGEPKREQQGWCFFHPEFPDEIGRILPVYKNFKGISAKRLRNHVWDTTKKLMDTVNDEISDHVLAKRGLPSIAEALMQIHYPLENIPDETPLLRLAYREIADIKKQIAAYPKHPAPVLKGNIEKFYNMIPFTPTNDQRKAIQEISEELASGQAMRSILVGDVGSGKTLVAQAAAFLAYQSNYRTLVLAPTIVLAGQLYDSFVKIFGKEVVSLYTGSSKDNPSMIIIGTHALLYREFAGVGLVVMDEQHRYGVNQRNKLLGEKHALQMTATPIPRTVNLLIHGAMKISVLNDTPYKRDVVTKVVPPEAKGQILGHIRQVVSNGGKVLIIFPLVENDKGDHKAVEQIKDVWDRLYAHQVMWVHGKLEDKLEIVRMFRESKIHKILVSTSLIETGIDIPEASLLAVSSAEKFGLAQLHQLRGRIGRRGNRSHCYYIYKNPDSYERLKNLEEITDGFRLAELDSEIRGWGEVFGEHQTGHCFKLPSLDLYKKAIQMVDEDLSLEEQQSIENNNQKEELAHV